MSNAARLREASALMRERAEAANEGPWVVADHWSGSDLRATAGSGFSLVSGLVRTDAQHIASWHPAVALAVADWLDACALVMEVAPAKHKGNALAVANAYLGGVA